MNTQETTPGFQDVRQNVDRLLGKVDALIALQREQDARFAARLDDLAERTVKVEQGVAATKDLVEAWAAAKTSFRFIKWMAGIAGALAGMAAALRGWLSR